MMKMCEAVVVVRLKEERAKMSRSFPLSVVCPVGWVVAAQRRGGGGGCI